MNKIQDKIFSVFKKHFGYTPLTERLKDIQREFFELMKWTDVKNLKEESGDLLCSLIQLHTENGWDIEENIQSTLDKIERRQAQYASLGRKLKVAIYGGAFDPITIGHVQVAETLLSIGEFDEVWIMPAYNHLHGKEMESAENRLKMCKLAVEHDKRIKVFDFEIFNKLGGETYHFVKKLKESGMNDTCNFSLVIGQDNANSFDTWVNYEELERMIRFVVVPRKGYTIEDYNAWYLKYPHIYINGETNIMEVSSSEVRKLLNDNDSYIEDRINNERLKTKIPESVYNYIVENDLYKYNE